MKALTDKFTNPNGYDLCARLCVPHAVTFPSGITVEFLAGTVMLPVTSWDEVTDGIIGYLGDEWLGIVPVHYWEIVGAANA
jgi:hypothetical protein